MTIQYYYKEYEIGGKTYYISQYADKPHFVKLWEYGYVCELQICGVTHKGCMALSRGLRSRPNLKRLFAD